MEERDDRERHYMDSQWVLYAIFRHRKDHSLEDVSERIGIPYDTMKKYVIGKMACPVEVLKKVYISTRHPLLKQLLEPEGFELIPRGAIKDCLPSTVDAAVVSAFEKILDLEKSYKKAIEDDHISGEEYRELVVRKTLAVEGIRVIFGKIAEKIDLSAIN